MSGIRIHDYSGQHNNGGGQFICPECYTQMHTEYGGPSCGHTKLSQYNPIITWEGSKDWVDALVAEFHLGSGDLAGDNWRLRDIRILSQLLTNELRTQASLDSIKRAIMVGGIPPNVLDTVRLGLLVDSSNQKINALEGLIQFGVSA